MNDGSNFSDVGDFHKKFGLHYVEATGEGTLAEPQDVPEDLLGFRIKFLFEELQEFLEGIGYDFAGAKMWDTIEATFDRFTDEVDHPKSADALIDLVYVAMGTAHLLGYPWRELWDDVQRANMDKVRAAADGSDSVRGSSYDVVKPPGWEAPRTAEILYKNGFGA